ncbi:hypothetical protein [Kingella potus]|uniref:hypothetical protein n=1 Tax=Kingella potus TaxID=265175 RepID=UPI001FD2BA32|nr:hypothetical protein [Kingella potus]UOP00085.1 hypothetical protein LVJ84_08900 [Kingella potus]
MRRLGAAHPTSGGKGRLKKRGLRFQTACFYFLPPNPCRVCRAATHAFPAAAHRLSESCKRNFGCAESVFSDGLSVLSFKTP